MQTGAGLRIPSWTTRMADVSTVLEKGHSRRDCPAGKRHELRGPRSGSEEPKVAKTTRARPRSRERRDGTEKEGTAGQDRPEPVAKIHPMKEVLYSSSPTRHQGRDRECGTGHCGMGCSRSYAALIESSEWNNSIGIFRWNRSFLFEVWWNWVTPSLGPVRDVWLGIHGWGT